MLPLTLWLREMASSHVPSRAVINALRGVFLTTSCSIILLAEERRRRINIAVAAVDNVRRLHSVRRRHRPAAVTSATALEEAAHSNDGVVTPMMRRRRRTTSPGREARSSDVEARAAGELIRTISSSIPVVTLAEAADYLKKKRGLVPEPTISATSNGVPLPPNVAKLSSDKLEASRTLRNWTHSPPRNQGRMQHNARLQKQQMGRLSGRHSSGASTVDAASAASVPGNQQIFQQAESFLQTPRNSEADAHAFFARGLAILDQLHEHFDRQLAIDRPAPGYQDIATAVLLRLESVRRVEPAVRELSTKHAIIVVQNSLKQGISRFCDTLNAMIQVFMDPVDVLNPVIIWLVETEQLGILEQALSGLDDAHLPKHILILEMLQRSRAAQDKFAKTWRIYECLCKAGMLSETTAENETVVRLSVASMAQEAGDNIIASNELGNLPLLDLSTVTLEVQMQILELLATLGQWTAIYRRLRLLKRNKYNSKLESFQRRQIISSCYQSAAAVQDFSGSIGAKFEHNVISLFNLLALRHQWSRICEAYELLWESGQPFSAPCLRIAVAACLKVERQQVAEGEESRYKTANLFVSAHEKGYDTSEALTSVFLQRLEDGVDVRTLLAVPWREGLHVHDMVYNQAAVLLAQQSNIRASRHICEMAARKNGQGMLAYNEYNFANLLRAYVTLRDYTALDNLLSDFTSRMQPCFGSSVCREAIKHTLKKIALRTLATEHMEIDQNQRKLSLERLDEALSHSKRCKKMWTSSGKRLVRKTEPGQPVWETFEGDPLSVLDPPESTACGGLEDGQLDAVPDSQPTQIEEANESGVERSEETVKDSRNHEPVAPVAASRTVQRRYGAGEAFAKAPSRNRGDYLHQMDAVLAQRMAIFG